MPLMRACACGDRTKTARVSPGRITSSVYWPFPVMKRRSSFRRTAAPIPVALMAVSSQVFAFLFGGRLPFVPHCLRASGDGLHDVVVPRAAAEIAVELLTDRVLVEVVALAAHDVERGHDHARRAIAALQRVVLAEGLLHRMQRTILGSQALDGG